MQTVRNRVADILGIDLPIVQAPMNYIAGHALAAAVSAAGGMGVLGPNAGKVQGEEISMRERTLREFARIREVTDKPVGINVVVPDGENKAALMYARSTVEAAAEGGATAAFCVGGLQPTIFELIKEKGMKLIVRPLTPTVKNAREAQAMGADIFVATGYDAGGFLPSHHTGTFSIVPTIVDAVTIPVLAAGGINDLRGVRAAFALGAEGVYVGTRFIATNECAANDHAKELICKLSGSNLLYSPSLLAWCLRCSNVSAISTFSVSLRFFEPFLRFCSKRLPSFIYCCSPMRLPNSMNAFPSGTPPLIWQLVSYIS